MSLNHLKSKIESCLKTQTNYIHNDVRIIYEELLIKTKIKKSKMKRIIFLKSQFEKINDPWDWSGVPNNSDVCEILRNLENLKNVI